MRAMTTLKIVLSVLLLSFGCGGDSKPTTMPAPAPEPAPVASEPTPPAADPAPAAPAAPAPALAFGVAKIKLEAGEAKAEVAISADGTFVGTATEPPKKTAAKAKAKAKPTVSKKPGKLTERSAFFEGTETAKLADDGTVSVLQGSKVIQDGKVVKDERTWGAIGTLDATGIFTLKSDSSKVSIGDDGKITGLMPNMTATFEGAPEMRRTAVFLAVAMMAGGSTVVESHSASDPNNQTVPVPPIKK